MTTPLNDRLTSGLFSPAPRVQRAIRKALAAFGRRRFTLDQFAQTWYVQTGATSLDFCQRALDWLAERGDVERAGLMHWKATTLKEEK